MRTVGKKNIPINDSDFLEWVKNLWAYIIVNAAILMLAASCGQQSTSLKFKTIEDKKFVKHSKATTDYQGVDYDIRFTYPAQYGDKAVLESLQRKFIEHVLGEKYASLTPEKAVKACIEDLKKMYEDNMKEYTSDGAPPLLYAHAFSDTILFMNDELLQMRSYGYVSEGGAHGFGGYTAYLFNLQTGEEYSRETMSRNAIFKTEASDNIRWLIIPELLKYWEKEDDDDFTFEVDAVWTENTDFALSSEGIIFLYSDYELGSYSLGSPDITIPYRDIFPFLREETPVWKIAKESVINSLGDKVRAVLDKEGLSIGSTLDELLKHYPKYKIEIFCGEMGSVEYTSLDDMFKGYGEDWYFAYKDWAIFTPFNPNGKEAAIRYFISFRDLDKRNNYKKSSKIWLVTEGTISD